MTFPRSLLFVPGNRTEMFEKAFAAGADAVIVDLEDSVPADQKAAARRALASLKPPAGWAGSLFARLNAHGTDEFGADVAVVRDSAAVGVILPKAERADQVRAAAHAFGRLQLILLVETPAGVMRAAELADSGVETVAGLAVGLEDYRAGIGVTALDPVLADFARATVVNAAAAARLVAIDAPELQVNDAERLRTSARRARGLGFRAKFAIHPSQVPIINDELSGGDDRSWAARVVEAYERATKDGRGAAALDGRMIDEATVKRARDILRK